MCRNAAGKHGNYGLENLGGYFKWCAYPGAKALKGQIGRSHYLTQPLPVFPPFPLFLILILITACSNSRASPFVWHCSKVVELFVKCVAMETNVCCHGDHVKSSFTSSLQTQEKRKRRQGRKILPWKTKCFEILAKLTEVSKIEVTFKPSTLTNNSMLSKVPLLLTMFSEPTQFRASKCWTTYVQNPGFIFKLSRYQKNLAREFFQVK